MTYKRREELHAAVLLSLLEWKIIEEFQKVYPNNWKSNWIPRSNIAVYQGITQKTQNDRMVSARRRPSQVHSPGRMFFNPDLKAVYPRD